eukprot:CAMPEP_0114245400 /NCGR_PEP_ID=MMETSP0058-20121206/11873_1 /TAXON_ID=36894 /ORGANISM="Pyramimonas parkeae, CCMP726" /LENGTH=234 /DNA_ID=CAMNT_0001358445 /DNA_START=132 /DNA_END=836 /DNA_ORIENTATION=+
MAPCRMDTEKMSHSEHYTVTVPVETLCGRIFEVEVNTPTPTILELRESIHEFLGIPMEAQRLSVDTKFYNDNDVIQVQGAKIVLQQNVYGGTGGAAGGCDFKLVTTIPEAIQFRCLCHKCGLGNLPDPMKEDWCGNTCCCLYESCGMKDCSEQQCLCLLVSQKGLNFEKKFPDLCQCRILCFKWGLKDFPAFKTEEWCTSDCCCIKAACGLKEWQVVQYLCLRCELTGDIANVI